MKIRLVKNQDAAKGLLGSRENTSVAAAGEGPMAPGH